MTVGPSAPVLAAFGVTGPVTLLDGGQGETFRAGDLVLKPAEENGETAWVSTLVAGLAVEGVRVARPVPATDGSWVAGGWAATRWVAGEPGPAGRWAELLEVCDRVHAGLAGAAPSDIVARRTHRWAVADRAAWGELSAPQEVLADPLVRRLSVGIRPVALPGQLVHGDLCGNVLFDPVLPPAVVDWSLYWRPAGYARAVVVVDGLLWYGADDELARAEAERPSGAQLLVRALLFRLIVDRINQMGGGDGRGFPPRYAEVADLVTGLAAGES